MSDSIRIKGARTHNLKSIDLEFPRGKLVVFTGVSGSGKSSLAFDTIFAEGQRRYIDSLSPYARQFMGQMDRPDVDEISGLSPAIAINQKTLSHNPRSIVATLTEIYDYMRVLWARVGHPHCPECGKEIKKLSVEEMFNIVSTRATEMKSSHLTILSPVVRGRKGEYYQLLYDFLQKGFSQARIDGELKSLHERVVLSRYKPHDIEIVIDRIPVGDDDNRLFEAIEQAVGYSDGLAVVAFDDSPDETTLSSRWSCPDDGFSFEEIEPRLFSFNSPYGACPSCQGLGKKSFFSEERCPDCDGQRLKRESLAIILSGKNIWEAASLDIAGAHAFFTELSLSKKEVEISERLVAEITSRLEFLLEVGLDYISLNQEASTLSRGEAQRIRLASQIGSKLSGTLYVLDEPTVGLHERDNEKLIRTLKSLRDLGNTVVVVEHDERVIAESDHLVDLGPRAGALGGEVVVSGDTRKLLKGKESGSLTLDYLRGKKEISPGRGRNKRTETLKVVGARLNNLKNIDVEIPLRKFVAISGVSGGGKSSFMEVLHKNTNAILHGFGKKPLENVSKVIGTEYIRKAIEVDQSPIGRTPRSNPATYTGILGPLRDLYANLEEARKRGYAKGYFSFNLKGGRCEACKGAGSNLIEMHFLPPITVRCDVCQGKRFNREVLEIRYKGKNISEVLDMTVSEALDFFHDIHSVAEKLEVLEEIGLGYLRLGQNAPTLSGGEAQRVKLAKELSNSSNRTLYLLDEPTTGLHYHDVDLLIGILQKLIDKGNSVLVIEHNLHLIRACDHVIDFGPDGGERGGRVIATGTPEEIARNKNSFTGEYLKRVL